MKLFARCNNIDYVMCEIKSKNELALKPGDEEIEGIPRYWWYDDGVSWWPKARKDVKVFTEYERCS